MPTRAEKGLAVLIFATLAGANGFRLAFNSAVPCALLALLLLGLRLSKATNILSLTRYGWVLTAILLSWVLGAVASAFWHFSSESLLNMFAGYLTPLLIFLSLVGMRFDQGDRRRVLVAVAVGALCPLLWGITAYYVSFGMPSAVDLFWNRYDLARMALYEKGAFGNTSHMGFYIAIALPPLLLMVANRELSVTARMLFGLASIFAICNALLVFSRGAIATLAAMVLFWVIALRSVRLLVFIVIASAMFGLALTSYPEVSDILAERTIDVVDDGGVTDPSVAGRIRSMITGWDLFLQNPIVGVGLGQSYRLNSSSIAHQFAIEEASSIGLAGLLATVMLTVVVLFRSAELALRRPPEPEYFALWSGALGWITYGSIAGGLLNLGLLIPWAGFLYGFLALTAAHPERQSPEKWAVSSSSRLAASTGVRT